MENKFEIKIICKCGETASGLLGEKFGNIDTLYCICGKSYEVRDVTETE